MAISLYDLCVPSFLQTVTSMSGVLDKGLAWCKENNVDPNEIVESRLWADMLPFRFQIMSVAHHSLGAINGVKAGAFAPGAPGTPDYAGLQALLADTRAGLSALTPAEVNALEGRDVMFSVRGTTIPFVAEQFLMSFSLPNFYFHATTGYDILRSKGVALGKRDYLGQMRIKK